MYVQHRLRYGAQAPGAARQALDQALSGRVAEPSLDELRLVVSELVTNAVRHGRDRRGAVELAVAVGRDRARVEVIDGGGGFRPPTGEPAPEQAGGWGLVVVDRLASRWGIDGGRSTRVWAELPLQASGLAGGGPSAPVYARNV